MEIAQLLVNYVTKLSYSVPSRLKYHNFSYMLLYVLAKQEHILQGYKIISTQQFLVFMEPLLQTKIEDGVHQLKQIQHVTVLPFLAEK